MSFRVGSRVIIVDTANVLARCPELVGSVGAAPRPSRNDARGARGAPFARFGDRRFEPTYQRP